MSRHLMARFSHLRIASEWRIPNVPITDEHRRALKFDWQEPEAEWRRKNRSSLCTHQTKLETGDEIHVGYAGEGYDEFPDYWDYEILGPVMKERPDSWPDYNKNIYSVYDETLPEYTRHPVGYQELLGRGGNGGEPRPESRDAGGSYTHPVDAMRAAEEHYLRLVRQPGYRKNPNNNLNYEKLVNPRENLDEDYGDIFGERP